MLDARGIWLHPPGDAARELLRNFSLSVAAGEWVALVGPNGSGKTLLVLALSGLRPVARGQVEWNGVPIGRREARAEIAMVLQDPSSQLLQPTVREELVFAAGNLGADPDRSNLEALRWSRDLGLDPDLDRDPRTLSAGRQQLVLIAAAMVSRPRLLIVDEPGAHLDRRTRVRVLELIRREVRGGGLAVVWVTQMEEEGAAADRVVTLGELGERVDSKPETPADAASSDQIAAESCLLRLNIETWEGTAGPHVLIDHPMAVALPRRGITALEGPNGSGKSVILGAAAGLLRTPQIQLEWSGAARPPILAAQYPELQLFEERIEDEVIYAAVSRGVERQKAILDAAELFDRLGLGGLDFMHRGVWDLSSGEKRLVVLVAALIAPADLVLLDEPTCGLDEERRRRLGTLIRERGKRSSVLIASQDGLWIRSLGATLLRLCEPLADMPSPS